MKKALSGAELEVMKILWKEQKPCSVQEVMDALASGRWAYKTVGTLLTRMEEKEAVVCTKKGRTNYYSPVLDMESYKREKTGELVSALYDGSVKNLAVSLFENGSMTDEDITEIRNMFGL